MDANSLLSQVLDTTQEIQTLAYRAEGCLTEKRPVAGEARRAS